MRVGARQTHQERRQTLKRSAAASLNESSTAILKFSLDGIIELCLRYAIILDYRCESL